MSGLVWELTEKLLKAEKCIAEQDKEIAALKKDVEYYKSMWQFYRQWIIDVGCLFERRKGKGALKEQG